MKLQDRLFYYSLMVEISFNRIWSGDISMLVNLYNKMMSKFRSMHWIQRDIQKWADAKIPDRTPDGQMVHLERELNELKDEWKAKDMIKAEEELADIIIVALNIAAQMGFDMQKTVLKKMEKNKKRTWSKPDAQGVIHHTNDE